MKLEEKQLVKAEILFSRKCNLDCSYCHMPDGRANTLSIENWKRGMDNLKKLGCSFSCFYGAEPLLEFEKLVEVLPYAESIGIDTSVITNGTIVGTKEKLKALYNAGGRSLSMSYDPIPIDKSSQIKSDKAIELLTWFKNLGNNVRDVAAIATLTKENYMELPKMVEKMSSLGIWTFYDIYHFDRHQPGSKTSAYVPRFAFDNTMDRKSLLDILCGVNDMKKRGFLVHTNHHYLDILEKRNGDILKNYNWNCADYSVFPSWVTVDCDGVVYPCDDFQPKEANEFNIVNLYEDWPDFVKKMKFITKALCPGCAWNTKIGAHAIKVGLEDINDYVHRR